MAARLCFVIPYFGSWPFWMPFYLRSCAANADINWLFYTDCGIPELVPENVRVVEISFVDYCRLVSSRLGIDFQPQSPYKLCDIKPALGLIHAQELVGYEHWGFGDIDVVYGNLRRYLSDERLRNYGLISTHARRVSGHLCVLRNDARWCEAFKRVPDWREQFSNPVHTAFDERAFSKLFIRRKNWPTWIRRAVDILNPLRRDADFTEQFSTPEGVVGWRDGRRVFPSCWYWHSGRLGCDLDSHEYPYLHFMFWKSRIWKGVHPEELMQVSAEKPAWSISPEGFKGLPHA